MKSVFPPEILEYSIELHRFSNLKKHKTIYAALLLFIFCASAALPFLKIDLYKTFPGSIRTNYEQDILTSPIQIKIEKVFISSFPAVNQGDTVLWPGDSPIAILLQENKSLHSINSPTNGELQGIKGPEKKNSLYKGSSIAELSPQTDLVVDCYVSPADVGLIKKEQEVKFRGDSFDHSNWSTASGHIIHIVKDIVNKHGILVHKVLCPVKDQDLVQNDTNSLKLTKGMSLTVSFFIEKRSLLQLLLDKLEGWYDPNLA